MMAIFSRSSTQGRDAAKRLISGHLALVAYWALRHAGVLDAMAAEGGIDAEAFAARKGMSPEVLSALLRYLASVDLVRESGGTVALTSAGAALREHEDGVLEFVRGYQPVVGAIEHLLARLKQYGPALSRRSDSIVESQGRRYADEVFPAIQRAVVKCGATHVLDLNCGDGELLLRLAKATKNLAGVGVGNEGPLVRRANEAITKAGVEKRFIAVTGNGVEVCTDTRDSFDRLGISTQFWQQVDCVVACNVFSELAGRDAAGTITALARLVRAFPGATLVLVEPVGDERRDPAYYAAEMDLLLALSRHALLGSQQWKDMLATAGMKVDHETALATDGLVLLVCSAAKPVVKVKTAAKKGEPQVS